MDFLFVVCCGQRFDIILMSRRNTYSVILINIIEYVTEYVDKLTVENCCQFKLPMWKSLIGQFVHPDELKLGGSLI